LFSKIPSCKFTASFEAVAERVSKAEKHFIWEAADFSGLCEPTFDHASCAASPGADSGRKVAMEVPTDRIRALARFGKVRLNLKGPSNPERRSVAAPLAKTRLLWATNISLRWSFQFAASAFADSTFSRLVGIGQLPRVASVATLG